MEAQMN